MKKVFFIIALLVLAVQVPAQGIYKASTSSMNSIVRVWNNQDVVIYNEDSLGNACFLLYTVGSSTAQQIDLPDGISVKDFEIFYNEVYFCGEIPSIYLPSANNGVIGRFNIPYTFNGTGSIKYESLYWYFDPFGYQMAVESLKRIDLFIDSGRVVMAMTGDSYLYGDTKEKRSTIVSAFFDYVGYMPVWKVYALMDKHGTAIYTDIAALDDVVTVVGTSVDGTGLIAKSFYKQGNFPAHPTTLYQADSIDYLNPIGKALIFHTQYNEAAITQLDYKTLTLLHLMDFSTGTAVPTAPSRATDFTGYTYSSPWNLHEIRFNNTTNNINVLEYGILPGNSTFETLLWTFYHSSSTIPSAYVEPINSEKQVSFDVDIDSRPVSVGEMLGSNMLDLHSHILWTNAAPILIPEPDNCNENSKINTKEAEPVIRHIPVDEVDFNMSFEEIIYMPEVEEIEFNPICE